MKGNPADSQLYAGALERIGIDYGIMPRDVVTDGGYASLKNQETAKGNGVVNIVFNKIVGSLKNIVTSGNMETRLKKWRSGIEAVISNFKRGCGMHRCEWKVLWSVIAYNIRVITSLLLPKLLPKLQ